MTSAPPTSVDPHETFADRLQQFGDATAIVTDRGERVTYAGLARRADACAQALGPARRLVMIEAANRLEPLVAYIGCLRAKHPVVLTAAGGDHERVISTFRPDAVFAAEDDAWRFDVQPAAPGGMHEDLRVLLSTSGTTGAAKLVRLSGRAVDANAASIATYLGITVADRAITSLPFHYSYGLSVVNSHLATGATLLLTDRSVVDPAFWTFFEAHHATSLAGVPYTYELLERVGFLERAPASLRTLTQAGGRLPAETVSRITAWSRERGVRFFVMYGQTEATARMAYLPPEHAVTHPGAIGVPIPGGEFRLIDEDGGLVEATDAVGELVYRGPNVMMGYATSRDDLARGAELTELHTGDLASRNAEGLYRISGRKSRFAKIFGLRVSLDEVEAQLGHMGAKGVAVSDDVGVYIATLSPASPDEVTAALAEAYKLPATVFQVSVFEDLPTLPSGKIDYQAILRAGQAQAGVVNAADASRHPIEAAFVTAFPRATPGPEDSFVSLGGDSLNYVRLSIEIEGALGFLPEDWERLSIGQLCALSSRTRTNRWWNLRTLETEVVVRMLAILAVVVNHASDYVVGGGADVLLILAGYNLSRYQKPRIEAGAGFTIAWSFFQRIIVPYYLLLIAYLIGKGEVDWPSLLLASNFFGRFGSLIEPFWFLEAIFQAFVVVAALSFIPAVRRAVSDNPWRFGLLCLAAALVLKGGVYALLQHDHLANRTPDAVLPLVAFGWCIHEAITRNRRIVMTLALAGLALVEVVGIPGVWPPFSYPTSVSHVVWLAVCAVGLLWVRRIPIPVFMHRPVGGIAAASFYIYLTHVVVLWVVFWRAGIKDLTLNMTLSIALGVIAWWVASRWTEAWGRRARRAL